MFYVTVKLKKILIELTGKIGQGLLAQFLQNVMFGFGIQVA